MAPHFVLDPRLDRPLRESIVRLWTDVANSGGPVGFAGPVTRTEVESLAYSSLAAVADGPDRLLVGYVSGQLVAMLFFVSHRFALQEHWRSVKRVMVDPTAQRRGYGAALMREGERIARGQGWAALHLTVRAGTGVERFYAGLGYQEVGRFPGALRLSAGDDRDEIQMWLPLDGVPAQFAM